MRRATVIMLVLLVTVSLLPISARADSTTTFEDSRGPRMHMLPPHSKSYLSVAPWFGRDNKTAIFEDAWFEDFMLVITSFNQTVDVNVYRFLNDGDWAVVRYLRLMFSYGVPATTQLALGGSEMNFSYMHREWGYSGHHCVYASTRIVELENPTDESANVTTFWSCTWHVTGYTEITSTEPPSVVPPAVIYYLEDVKNAFNKGLGFGLAIGLGIVAVVFIVQLTIRTRRELEQGKDDIWHG